MNTEFIKWLCEKAEWVMIIYDENDIEISPPNKSEDEDFFTDIGTFMSHYAYGYLLTRAIEEINQSDETCYFIQINSYSTCIHNVDTGKDIEIFDYTDGDGMVKASSEDINTAKELALKYIWDRQ